MMNKSQLRKQITEIVSGLTCEEKEKQSKVIFQKLINHPRYKNSKKLSIYLSTANEVNTIPILRHSLEVENKQCYVPFVRKSDSRRDYTLRARMVMYQITSVKEYEEWSRNSYGIKEPPEPLDPSKIALTCSKHSLDLIIVPGLAFSRDGHRLGKGKGYYDEYLTDWLRRTRKALYCIGLAFKQQLVNDTKSVDGQDYVLDEVLTV